MSGPDPHALRRILVGDFSTERAIVLTPIQAMFQRFTAHGWTPPRTTGWWPRLERDDVHVILVPQGTALLDLCPALGQTPKVHLIGYAGALSPTVQIGQIVRPGVTTMLGDERHWPLGGDPGHLIATAPHLLAAYAAAERRATRAQVVDMESAHLARALAGRAGAAPVVRVLVTDRWPDQPFYAPLMPPAVDLRQRRTLLVDECAQELA